MIEDLKMVRDVLKSSKSEDVARDIARRKAITKLTAIIEQMEKAEQVYQIRPDCENWIDCTPQYFEMWNGKKRILFTHPAPTPDEITKLREQLAACQKAYFDLTCN